MKENFGLGMQLWRQDEGGFVNNPHDPGGATNEGITQRVYDAFRALAKLPVQSVRAISDSEAQAILRPQYWDAIHGDDLPGGIDVLCFSDAGNAGPVAAAKRLQSAAGVTADGHVGLVTLAAVRGVNDRIGFINRYSAARLSFLEHLRNWAFFGRGWKARVQRDQAFAILVSQGKAPGQTPAGGLNS